MSRPINTDAPRSASRHTIGVPRYGEDATVEDRARAAEAFNAFDDAFDRIVKAQVEADDRAHLIPRILICLGIPTVIAAVILGLVWLCR